MRFWRSLCASLLRTNPFWAPLVTWQVFCLWLCSLYLEEFFAALNRAASREDDNNGPK